MFTCEEALPNVIHDPQLLELLENLPTEPYSGAVYRATRQNLDPLASSTSGGRWMRRDGAAVLYTSFKREGALAEIAFHYGQMQPRPTKPVLVHTLEVTADRTLRLLRANLDILGVPAQAYGGVNLPRTQELGAAIEFLGCDGLIAPSARWPCDNLILFPDRMEADTHMKVTKTETVDWISWAKDQGLLS